MAGGCACGENEAGFWIGFGPGAEKFQGEDGFSNTDGVKVYCVGVLEFLFGGVEGEALVESSFKASAFEHFNDPTGEGDDEEQGEQRAIEDED